MEHPLSGKWETELKPGDKLVAKRSACPECGERREKMLPMAEDGVACDCAMCGTVFVPKEGR